MEVLETHKGQRIDSKRTICEVHRQLADMLIIRLKDQPEILKELLSLLDEAYKLGIKLVLALIERKIDLPQWENNDVPQVMKLRKIRNDLVKELNEDCISI